MTKQKSKGQLKQLKHFSMKIQEFTSNVVITEKNEKTICQSTAKYTRDPREFSGKVAPDLDGFTDGQSCTMCCEVVKNTFLDDSK